MSYVDWHVGMKVVCVDAPVPGFTKWKPTEFFVPIIGQVYTLREVFAEDRFPAHRGSILVRLEEIRNKAVETYCGPYEAAFAAEFFRPLQKRATDISIFTAMLTPHREKERV